MAQGKGGGISAVLQAMQIPEEVARGTIRLSMGPSTTVEEIDLAAAILIAEIKKQRG